MTEANKETLGKVASEKIEEANVIAEMLLNSREQREKVRLQFPDGREISGFAFRDSEGSPIIVTNNFIATVNKENKIDRVLPRFLD